MQRENIKTAVALATVAVAAFAAEAKVELAGAFSDGAVLQRGMRVPVWGTAGMPQVLGDFDAYAKEHGLGERYIGVRQPIEVYMHRSWDKFLTEGL